ncbi:class I SAM-dependent methyltransferase [Prosthecobacter sp.]|uniref:class I SAM-dependent methyltransferase n=1 Tax=Prosthecobacter sp. TaxID=1965333 RepID=UPI0024875AF3|nr:class I SAM-dependent methyltransferase [Prosthecobacter sp.]MDI1313830.1 class I SAM-dependent methyltransferase [Prosthecobacter sp.]
MPFHTFKALKKITAKPDRELLQACKDEEFDQLFPASISALSLCHWSPVNVCRTAAQFLVTAPGTRVLDIGCGPGKFCVIGATSTAGHFTGVEQRKRLVRTASELVERHRIPRVEFQHGNINQVQFREFDAFYLFNPFQENVMPALRIDYDVELEPKLYTDYTAHVQQQLMRMPMATRVASYCGDDSEIPSCYACEKTAFTGKLKLWVKKHPAPAYATAAESYAQDNGRAIPLGTGPLALA